MERGTRKRSACEDSAAEQEPIGGADDSISVERADLRHSYASSTNLLEEPLEQTKRRCIVCPASSEDGSCGDQTNMHTSRWGCYTLVNRCSCE